MKLLKNTNKDKDLFTDWLDKALDNGFPENIEAIHFNLYDDSDNRYSIEVVGARYFDEEDPDWPCYEETDFNTREHPFEIICREGHQEAERIFTDYVKRYLKQGAYANKLKQYSAVGIGFVDGDITLLYKQ